jgi:lysophospholipid acyltransferase (LPLAT)-like uncharacterized protein
MSKLELAWSLVLKFRSRWLIAALGVPGAWLVRLWIGTLRYRYRPLGVDVRPDFLRPGERYIYVFWHENMLLLAYHYGRPNIRVLISQHADGQLIADICRHLGFGLVRGSTTRGGVEAMRHMLRASQAHHMAITPDGPRGPRRQLQPGLVYLAARTGLAIVPAGIGYCRPWRMKSWDRFALPRPFSVATCVTASPIRVPPEAGRTELEHYQELVEREMLKVTTLAESWAENHGIWPDIHEIATTPEQAKAQAGKLENPV